MKLFVNPVTMNIPVDKTHTRTRFHDLSTVDPSAFITENAVSETENRYIMNFLQDVAWQPVSVTGMQGNYEPGDTIGSWRASSFQEAYAQELFNRIKPNLPNVKECNEKTNTDWDNHSEWEPIGVNPLLRFIKYTDGGLLIPHYDAPYIASEDTRTLMSLVIYLDNDPDVTGGALHFLNDKQAGIPVTERDLNDLTEPAGNDDVLLSMTPKANSAVLFDHRILHESQKLTGTGQKTIIRTDIMYRKIHR
jgi:hypothetical protein